MNVKRVLTSLLITMGLGLAMVACNSEPQKPEDETKNKLHDDPRRVEIMLTEGHLDGTNFAKTGDTQTIIYEAGAGWGMTPNSPNKVFEVKGDKTTAYFMEIHYYNEKNEEITHEFVTNGQENIHQHFFTAQDFNPATTPDGTELKAGDQSFYNYVYLDTNPWNKTATDGGVLVKDNPIGMKGAFHFNVPNINFNMRIRLMHARGVKKNEKGQYSSFNRPTNAQVQTMYWDLDMKIPFTTGSAENVDPNQALSEDQPVTAEATIYGGHFHGTNNFHENPWPKEMKYYKFPQTIKLALQDGQWKITDDSPSKFFAIVGGVIEGTTETQDKTSPYALLINYYNKDGKLLNGHFLDGDAVNKYQHFFITKNFRSTDNGKPIEYKSDENFIRYVYMDTDPWNKTIKRDGATRIGEDNPAGFKGYFGIYHKHVKFDMNVKLVYTPKGKKEGGHLSPFYAPTSDQLKNVVVDMNLPVVTLIGPYESLNANDWEEYSGDPTDYYTAEDQASDKAYIKRFMDVYKISEREAFDEALWIINGDRVEDVNKGFWF